MYHPRSKSRPGWPALCYAVACWLPAHWWVPVPRWPLPASRPVPRLPRLGALAGRTGACCSIENRCPASPARVLARDAMLGWVLLDCIHDLRPCSCWDARHEAPLDGLTPGLRASGGGPSQHAVSIAEHVNPWGIGSGTHGLMLLSKVLSSASQATRQPLLGERFRLTSGRLLYGLQVVLQVVDQRTELA